MNKKILIASAFLAAATMVSALTTWSGPNGDYRVDTGLDDGSDESGYWYTYADDANGGSSAITWPVPTGNEYDDNALDPIIDNCGGLCGNVSLGAGYDYPFAGLGFNLTGPSQTGADVTSWGGVCITYSASVAPILEVAPEDEATVTEYNNYMSKLKVAASKTTVNLAWSDFKQESGWGVTVPQASYLGMVAAVKVKFSGKAGTSGDFNIMEVGENGQCPGGGSDAISAPVAASSVKAMLSGRTLSFSGINSVAAAEVINLQGQVVLKGAVSASSSLNLASLDAGVYMVRVAGKAVNHSQKIVLK
ncbi:MAG: T9SS type A sorting domain-containing protein [Fibrobacteraceae bacterium]|nr:T9SS type A sorting domain-containing protein [Fibrobacteraceae bacterium]